MSYRKALLLFVLLPILAGGRLRAEGKAASIKGWVLDSACAFTKDLSKPISSECAIACAKAGSPLVVLADDGTIYWPIADTATMPAKGQNDRLMKFAGQKVSVQGMSYVKGGSHALVVEKIEAAGK